MKEENPFDFEKALDFIYSRRKYAKSSSLERMEALLDALGRVQDGLRFVHVIGTNGKGSTAHMISRALSAAGHTVGLFTSPFVVDFRERIQINGNFVSKELFIKCVDEARSATNKLDKSDLSPTFFEVVLAVALLSFKYSACDIVVLEAGIGGLHDSTNVIPAPLVTVITSVSLDHTDMLGNTVSEIAREKCGAIKRGSTVISFPEKSFGFGFLPQPKEASEEIKRACSSAGVQLVFPDLSGIRSYSTEDGKICFECKNLKLTLPMVGDHQLANAAVAVEALFALKEKGVEINDRAIVSGFEKAAVPGRMETYIYNEKEIILDGGHNPGCMYALKSMLEKQYAGKSICAVLGFMKDKDHEEAISIIAPLCRRILFTSADKTRGEDTEILAEEGRRYCSIVETEGEPLSALKKALCSDSEIILIAGSFYLVSELRNHLTNDL